MSQPKGDCEAFAEGYIAEAFVYHQMVKLDIGRSMILAIEKGFKILSKFSTSAAVSC
jgi:hypothetical protein